MRSPFRTVLLGGCFIVLGGCGGGGGGGTPTTPATPVPTPVPTPEPAGTIVFHGGSLPVDSTVSAFPMHEFGQQAPDLFFWATVNLEEDLPNGIVQAFVRTEERRCMGGGLGFISATAGVDTFMRSLSMSHQAMPRPSCVLPYTTTHVEFVVTNLDTQQQVMASTFPAIYHFVAAE